LDWTFLVKGEPKPKPCLAKLCALRLLRLIGLIFPDLFCSTFDWVKFFAWLHHLQATQLLRAGGLVLILPGSAVAIH